MPAREEIICGITGWLDFSAPWPDTKASHIIESMCLAIRHRGPDSWGKWHSSGSRCVLGHRRLAIVDLTPSGHQPMVSASGRFVISFNGEVYNFPGLREDLEVELGRVSWRGSSDTEVLLCAMEHWGIDKTLTRLDGMFAFALWDCQKEELILARDRLGEKPLYYARFGSTLIFGSELKAIRAHPKFKGEIDRESLALLMRYSYVPQPRTIYTGVQKLPPSTYLKVIKGDNTELLTELTSYWSISEVALRGRNQFNGSFDDAVDTMDSLLKASVKERMLADVPLGAFLSGGIDSSLTVAAMQAQSTRPVRTFSIGFEFSEYDESPWARAVAKHLGTDHTEHIVSAKEALQVVPDLPAMYDEPFADSSQIPTFLVSKIARQHVTVSLSGDAGDEFFGGYTRYFMAANLWRKLGPMPENLRVFLSDVIGLTPDSFFRMFQYVLPRKLTQARLAEKARRFAHLLASKGGNSVALALVSYWHDPLRLVKGVTHEPQAYTLDPVFSSWSLEERFMLMDMLHYLSDDILVKVDRAAMAVSLETRVPFLDTDIMDFAWSLPLHYKVGNGEGKLVLKKLLARYVPEKLFIRPKMGFGIPLEHWLRKELRDWAESLLEPSRLRNQGYLNADMVQSAWRRHLNKEAELQHPLWPVLMFQAWLEHQEGTVEGRL